MGFPSKNKIEEMRALLEKAEPSRTLPSDATVADQVKYKICEKFAAYLLDKKVSQAELARQIGVDPSRINEIIKYRIDLYTIDKLVEFAERLDPNFTLEVA